MHETPCVCKRPFKSLTCGVSFADKQLVYTTMYCILLCVYARSCHSILAVYNVYFNPCRVRAGINENVLLRYYYIVYHYYSRRAEVTCRLTRNHDSVIGHVLT